jgi:hypothetical protein
MVPKTDLIVWNDPFLQAVLGRRHEQRNSYCIVTATRRLVMLQSFKYEAVESVKVVLVLVYK